MTAFDFPNSPSNGDTYTANGVSFQWNGSVWKRSSTSGGVPVGTIVAYGGSTAPSGWQICSGGTASTSELQTVLGQTNVPDLRDKFVMGAGSTYSRHATGGNNSKTLGTAELPSHTHQLGGTVGNDTHSHTWSYTTYSDWSETDLNIYETTEGLGSHNKSTTNDTHNHDLPSNTGSQGGTMGQSFSILNPYYALIYIIKT